MSLAPKPLWTPDLDRAGQPIAWLWHGLLAPGQITLMTSQWKTGKTTLVSLLLSRRVSAQPLAGLTVTPGGAAVLSEESPSVWRLRTQKTPLGPDIAFYCRPFHRRPTEQQFHAFLKSLFSLHQERGLDLLVIDPLSFFLPSASENDAHGLQAALLPLRRLADSGFAVLLLHHPRKGPTLEGQASRGSGALPAFADILIEMHALKGAGPASRRRRFFASSRFEDTPRHLLLELTEDGADYVPVHEAAADDFFTAWTALQGIFEEATCPLTVVQTLSDWPSDYARPHAATLQRWLNRAIEEGRLSRLGEGRRSKPFLYYLPAKMERWKDNLFFKAYFESPFVPPRPDFALRFDNLPRRRPR